MKSIEERAQEAVMGFYHYGVFVGIILGMIIAVIIFALSGVK